MPRWGLYFSFLHAIHSIFCFSFDMHVSHPVLAMRNIVDIAHWGGMLDGLPFHAGFALLMYIACTPT